MSQDSMLRSILFPGLNTQSQYDPGVCYVCGRWSAMRRRVCIHEGLDMLICWVCPDCNILAGVEKRLVGHLGDKKQRTDGP